MRQSKSIPIEQRWKDDRSFSIEPAKHRKQNCDDFVGGVGVLVIRDGKILTGLRRAEGTFCGPGGHIEVGESPEQAAIRETQEEFGITPKELIPLGELKGVEGLYCPSTVFLCTDYEGRAQADGGEMQAARFMDPEQMLSLIKARVAFQPFAESIQLLLTQCLTSEIPLDTIKVGTFSSDGGPGSGNFGHKGVPGQVGGSAPSGGSKYTHEDYRKALIGQKTIDGKVVKDFTLHAIKRYNGRDVYPSSIANAIKRANPRPGNIPGRTVYEYHGTRVVLSDKDGAIITVIYVGKGKK